jgi:hypothetical protein
MEPVSFSDEELEILRALSAPLDHRSRDAFLLAVAEALGDARGQGAVHRVARQVQRQFFTPPLRSEPGPMRASRHPRV